MLDDFELDDLALEAADDLLEDLLDDLELLEDFVLDERELLTDDIRLLAADEVLFEDEELSGVSIKVAWLRLLLELETLVVDELE